MLVVVAFFMSFGSRFGYGKGKTASMKRRPPDGAGDGAEFSQPTSSYGETELASILLVFDGI